MLENSIAGKWLELREVNKKKTSLTLGWVYEVDNNVAMLIKIENNICILINKEGKEFQAEKKDLKIVA
jgi:hypothetical protein